MKKWFKKLKNLFNPEADVSISIKPKIKYDNGLKNNGFSFNITKKF